MLNKVAEEDREREKAEFEEAITRYKSLLFRVAKEKRLDITISIEGIPQNSLDKEKQDLIVLEKVQLVKGQTKYTHRNEYRQYELTSKGAEVVEKLSKENNKPRQ